MKETGAYMTPSKKATGHILAAWGVEDYWTRRAPSVGEAALSNGDVVAGRPCGKYLAAVTETTLTAMDAPGPRREMLTVGHKR